MFALYFEKIEYCNALVNVMAHVMTLKANITDFITLLNTMSISNAIKITQINVKTTDLFCIYLSIFLAC